jgi:phenylpropionate dioxygenase-like ring-hydroxylating dioxygenase large terminal subunit
MLSREDNERLCRVGPGTPMGEMMRRYWQPALLSWELKDNDGVPVRVRLLGEDLIAFRDTEGRIGLVDAYCPHRRAPMFYGRNEECGLRCVYHGWKFAVDGRCVDVPALPPNNPFIDKVRIKSYPTYEKAGVIFAYMGPPDRKPPFPDYEWMRAPDTHRFVSKNYQASNYLQALEGGLDTSHSSFLHNNVLGNRNTMRNLDPSPQIDVYPTRYGYSYVSTRKISEEDRYIRIYHYVMPFQQMRGDVTGDGGQRSKVPKIDGHFWVPIDDHQTHVWNWMYGADETAEITSEFAEKDEKRAGRGKDDFIPGTFKLKSNPSNDHMIDRNLQKTKTYTGIVGVGTQDMAVQESMEPIVDRSQENLIWTDRAIMAMRKMMLEATRAVERGEDPPGVDPADHAGIRPYDTVIKAGVDWRKELAAELTPRW